MKLESLLKATLVLLIVALVTVLGSWLTSEVSSVRAQGGGGGAEAGQWMMVASEIAAGDGMVYMFNTEKQVLLVYAYHRGFRNRSTTATGNIFIGDLQFLAGRHCRWDLLYAQLTPFPYTPRNPPPSKDIIMPSDIKTAFEKLDRESGK